MSKKQTSDTVVRYRSSFGEAWTRLRRRPSAMISLVVIILIFLVAIFADVLADYNSTVVYQDIINKLHGPSMAHLLGTDHLGRDILGRLIHGTRTALKLGLGATAISCVVGIILACLCAFFGGIVDMVVMRCMDILSSIPSLVLAIAIVAGLGTGLPQLIVAVAAGGIAPFTRMMRSKTLTIANMEYMEAGRALGASNLELLLKYMIPNMASIIIIEFTAQISQNILMGATLTFIGLGVQSPMPEWGLMLSEGMDFIQFYPYLIIGPGLALILTALSINTFGDCLRDALDPQLKGRA